MSCTSVFSSATSFIAASVTDGPARVSARRFLKLASDFSSGSPNFGGMTTATTGFPERAGSRIAFPPALSITFTALSSASSPRAVEAHVNTPTTSNTDPILGNMMAPDGTEQDADDYSRCGYLRRTETGRIDWPAFGMFGWPG